MERAEREYFELLGMVEEVKEEMQIAMKEAQKLPNEMFKVSTNIFSYSDMPDRRYNTLAAKVQRASGDIEILKSHWQAVTRSLEAISFKLFLAEAHVLAHTRGSRQIRQVHQVKKGKKWEHRYKSYCKGY